MGSREHIDKPPPHLPPLNNRFLNLHPARRNSIRAAHRDIAAEISRESMVVNVVASASQKNADGHVLVFLPGLEEIRGLERLLLSDRVGNINFNDTSRFEVHTLHSTVPLADQQA